MQKSIGVVVVLLAAAVGAWLLLGAGGPGEAATAGAAPDAGIASPSAVPPEPAPRPMRKPAESEVAPVAAAQPAVSAGASVHVVERASGAPIAGALVRAVGATSEWRAVSDASGDASLPAECTGSRTVWVSAEGWGTRRAGALRLGGEAVRVEMTRGTRVRLAWRSERGDELAPGDARARYEQASVVASVRVVAESAIDAGRWNDRDAPLRSPPGGWQTVVGVAWTDDGACVSERLERGRWRLVVQRPSAAPFVTEPFTVDGAPEAIVRVDLADAAPARRVRVIDAVDGHPLAGASIVPWFTLVKDFAQVPGAAVVADADGLAAVPVARRDAAGARPVWSVESGGHAAEFDDALLAARPSEDPLVVRVFPTATIEGEAYTGPGSPAAGAEVSWASRGGPAVRCVCGPDGRFSLAGVPVRRGPEEMVSLALATESGSRFFAVQAASGSTTHVVLGPKDAAAKVASVTGRVSAGGRPLVGLQVVLAPLADARTLLFAATRADGTFEFGDVPDGTAKLRVTCGDPRVADAFRIASANPFRVAAGETTKLDFDLPDAAFAVTVVDAATGEPIEGARVTATPLDVRDAATRFPGAVFTPGWSAFTDSSGRAALPGIVAVAAHRIDATDGRGRSARAEDAVPGTVSVPSEVRLALSK